MSTDTALQQHTISLYVRNQPGVLVRVALVFSRRGFNIDSLVVSPAALGDFSRMTITSTGVGDGLEQIVKQLAKLVDVVHAIDHTDQDAVETEIALVKLRADLDKRTTILQIAEHYGAKVVDYTAESLILRLYGASDKLDNAVHLLSDFDIVELVRSGKVIMARGGNTT